MLARSAERLYWLGRYLERTENTARLISVYMNLMFDLPMNIEISWGNLLTIFGANQNFARLYNTADEQNIMNFLLVDNANSASLLSSIKFARENIRTSRELMPDEAWQQVNEMYLAIQRKADITTQRRGRVVLLSDIMRGCQRFTGFLAGAMSQDDAYRLLKLGRNIERADMTTRILDIGSVLLAEDRSEKLRQYENTLWINVLRSLSALLMYRKHRRLRINSGDVLDYLVKDHDFPRSVLHCLNEVKACYHFLPKSDGLEQNVNELVSSVAESDFYHITPQGLHDMLDSIQYKLGVTHNQIAEAWFLPAPAA